MALAHTGSKLLQRSAGIALLAVQAGSAGIEALAGPAAASFAAALPSGDSARTSTSGRPATEAWPSRWALASFARYHGNVHVHSKSCGHGAHQAPPSVSGLPDTELSTDNKACWSCDHMVQRGGVVCKGCDKIQPVDASLNHFELFGIRTRFDIDLGRLEQRYKRLQFSLHPDKVTLRAAEEREYSAEHASTVNQAYSILKSPLSRANYLLMLKGIHAGEGFEGTIEDPELLMEVLEAREEVESSSDVEHLKSMLEQNRQRQEAVVTKLSGAFARSDTDAAVSYTTQLTYLVRLEQEIVKKI